MRKSFTQVSKHICVLTFFAFFAFFAFVASAQSTVRGKVTDSKDGSGLAGVTVSVKDTKIGTQTKSDGGFSVNVPPGSGALVFTAVGFVRQEVPIGGQSSFNISLHAAPSFMM